MERIVNRTDTLLQRTMPIGFILVTYHHNSIILPISSSIDEHQLDGIAAALHILWALTKHTTFATQN